MSPTFSILVNPYCFVFSLSLNFPCFSQFLGRGARLTFQILNWGPHKHAKTQNPTSNPFGSLHIAKFTHNLKHIGSKIPWVYYTKGLKFMDAPPSLSPPNNTFSSSNWLASLSSFEGLLSSVLPNRVAFGV